MWPRKPHAVWLWLGTLALVGCPQNQRSIEIQLVTLTSGGLASSSFDPQCDDSALPRNYKLRVTFLRRKVNENGIALPISAANLRDYSPSCYRVVNRGEKNLEFLVPDTNPQETGRYAVRVEAFDPEGTSPTLRYAGQVEDLKLDVSTTIYLRPTANPQPDMNLDQTGRSCVRRAPQSARAFHSATLLPNGQVLLIGGLATDKDAKESTNLLAMGAGAGAYVNGRVEAYDPLTANFNEVTVPSEAQTQPVSLVARAFHQAVLLPSPPEGPYRVLLLGGVQPKSSVEQAFQIRTASTTAPFLFSPQPSAVAAPGALVEYDPQANQATVRALPDLPRLMFPAVVQSQTEIVFAGGATGYAEEKDQSGNLKGSFQNEETSRAIYHITLNDGDPVAIPAEVKLTDVRAGHALARLSAGEFVVMGGQMSGEQTAIDTGEYLANGDAAYKPFVYPPETPSAGISTAWHTLTPLGVTDGQAQTLPQGALWAGGYQLKFDSTTLRIAEAAPQPILHVVASAGGSAAPSVTPVASENEKRNFEAVGYHAGLQLHDGSVLLSGGCKGASFTASSQILVYKLTDSGLVLQLGGARKLAVPRFGHSTTRLLDNTVLITGGITTDDDGKTHLLSSAEVFSPRTGDPSEDFPLLRADVDQAPEDSICKPR